MDYLVVTYIAYLLVAVPLTVWVGRTLFRNGRVFLVDVFDGDEDLANAVNHLLVVGFFLVNLGYIALALKVGHDVSSTRQSIEALSVKAGAVSLVLGGMHFANLYVLNRLRRRSVASARQLGELRPPVAPDAVWQSPASASC